jgi:hypothetical protein
MFASTIASTCLRAHGCALVLKGCEMTRGIGIALAVIQTACLLPDVSPVAMDSLGMPSPDGEHAISSGTAQPATTSELRAPIATEDANGPVSSPMATSGVGGDSSADIPQLMGSAGVGGATPVGSGTADSQSAMASRPKNPCEQNNGGCSMSPKAQCEAALSGERTCICPSGYTGSGIGVSGCADLNECEADNGGCSTSPVAKCMNHNGRAPSCECPLGFLGDGVGDGGCMPARIADEFVVSDGATQLTWQRYLPAVYDGCTCDYRQPGTNGCVGDRQGSGEACILSEASRYCALLSLQGRGWRLPSAEELDGLMEKDKAEPPFIDLVLFPNTPAEQFWSSSTNPTDNWPISVSYGMKQWTAGSEALAYRVRCVRPLQLDGAR